MEAWGGAETATAGEVEEEEGRPAVQKDLPVLLLLLLLLLPKMLAVEPEAVGPSSCGSFAGEESCIPLPPSLRLLLSANTVAALFAFISVDANVAGVGAASLTAGGREGGKGSTPPFFNTFSASLQALRYFSRTFR